MKRGYNGTPKAGKKKRKSQGGSLQAVSLKGDFSEDEDFVIFEAQKEEGPSLKQVRGKACPWMGKKTADIRDPLLRFHNQIYEFYHYISATPSERQARKIAFLELKKIIQEVVPECEVKQFGSSALGLQLPDGDIDITILIEEDEIEVLSAVYNRLRHDAHFTRLEFRRGKVPIINLHSVRHDYQIDISVNKRDGLKQLLQSQRMTNGLPEFKFLYLVLKCFLKIRGYSETYHGYVGSYLLFCMVFEYLYLKYEELSNFSKRFLLSQDLMSFMDFYSSTDWSKRQVFVGRGLTRERTSSSGPKPSYFRFLSPQNTGDDIGGKAFKIKEVFYCFKNRLQLIRNKNFRRGESVLKELLNPSMQDFYYPGRGSQ